MGKIIYFSKEQHTFFLEFVKKCKEKFKDIIVPPMKLFHQTEGPGKKLNEVLDNLTTGLSFYILHPEELHETAVNKLKEPESQILYNKTHTIPINPNTVSEQYYQGLCQAWMKSYSLCFYIFETLEDDSNKTLRENNKTFFYEASGYFLLLASTLIFNEALYNKTKTHFLLPQANAWLKYFELDYLLHIKKEPIRQLHSNFSTQLIQFQHQSKDVYFPGAPAIKDIRSALREKNKRAARYGIPYFGAVIQDNESTFSFLPSPSAMESLLGTIKMIIESNQSQRLQLLFYYNHEFGQVDVIDICFLKEQKILQIINVSTTSSSAQYHFLNQLVLSLKSLKVPSMILACKATIENNKYPAFYAYALSGEIAKCSFKDLIDNKFFCYPPYLEDTAVDMVSVKAFYSELFKNPPVWFKQEALGEKAIFFLSPSFEKAYLSLTDFFGKEKSKNSLDTFRAKYEISESDPKKVTFNCADFRFSQFNTPQTLSLENIQQKLSVKKKGKEEEKEDKGQIMRRAVHFCRGKEFDFLIKEFSKLSLDENPINQADNNKKFTPLHHSLQNGNGKRTATLLLAGANPNIPNALGETAKDIFSKSVAPKIKDNRVLKDKLKT